MKVRHSLGDFINELTKQQFQLRCERAMAIVTLGNSKYFYKEIGKDYKAFILQEKNYYSRFLEIISGINSAYTKIPIASPPIGPERIPQIPHDLNHEIVSFQNFVELLLGPNGSKMNSNFDNKLFQDFLSFSLFPSISSFFTFNIYPDLNSELPAQKHNFNNVFPYISEKMGNAEDPSLKTIYQKTFDLLMRPLFASQYFVKFCINFFQPILRALRVGQKFERDFPQLFNEYFALYSHLIPPFIAIDLLYSDDPLRTLWNSFLEIALSSPETAQYYGLFHYSTSPEPEFLAEVKRILSISNGNGRSYLNIFISNLSSIRDKLLLANSDIDLLRSSSTIDDNRKPLVMRQKEMFFEEDVFTPENKAPFRQILLSSIDSSLLGYILDTESNGVPWTFVDNENNRKTLHWLYFDFPEFPDPSYMNDETANDHDHDSIADYYTDDNINELATLDHNKENENIIQLLRHLLQSADPLPYFEVIPNMIVEDFLTAYLVERGPFETLPTRRRYYQELEVFLKMCPASEKINILMKSLKQVVIYHVGEIEKMAIATKTKTIIQNITYLNTSVNNEIINLVNNIVFLQDQSLSEELKKLKRLPNEGYLADPQQIVELAHWNLRNLKNGIFNNNKILFMQMIDRSLHTHTKFFVISYQVESFYPFIDSYLEKSKWKDLDSLFISFLYGTGNVQQYFINDSFPDNGKAKNTFIRAKLKNINKFRNEIRLMLIDAFNEKSILRAFDIFLRHLLN